MALSRERLLAIAALLVALGASVAFASVFTYYPGTIGVQPTPPVVVFQPGSNAGTDDVSGTIAVNIGDNGTSLAITVHPTYQLTYYENITVINNKDSKAWNIWVDVAQALTGLPAGSKAYLIIYDKGAARSISYSSGEYTPPTTGPVAVVNLTTTGQHQIGQLSAGGVYEVDLFIYIPEGTTLPTSAVTAQIHLIATPTTETPPSLS
ncbi:MAG: hypothetical protein GSR80_000986 [Desulfurococcales archaeon]|nr:hypothetical protein [Desulfurococcales archaeon]